MICDKCGKNTATTHIHTVINGVVTEKNLCADCAMTEGYSDNGLMGLFSSLLNTNGGVGLTEEKCEKCGTTFSQIAKSGKMGCPECYKKFSKQLLPYLKRLHGSVKHIGKRNETEKLVILNGDEKIAEMRKKLNELISREEFEEAAVLRDEIKKMKGESENE